MGFSGRRIRPLVVLAVIAAGAFSGYELASKYIQFLNGLIGGGELSKFLKHLGLLPNVTIKENSVEATLLLALFIVIGGLLGVVVERVIFIQSRKARASLERMAPQDKIAVGIGIILGLVFTLLLQNILRTTWLVNIVLGLILCYVSVVGAYSCAEQISYLFTGTVRSRKAERKYANRPKILDTNVIIDGRIADVCRAGFVEGPILIPKFVLEELQQIADSSDSLKRARGRRGLDILNQMQKEMELQVPDLEVDDSDEEVDSRLVVVARQLGGAIVTNDFNLNKVAELQGIDVLNVNELANALKPVVLPGEEMKVTIIKEGKEKEQGIGYLDDGTMIVVEGARRMIGEALDVSVTSVLQTVQGKMIFGKMKEDDGGYDSVDGVRSYSGSRPRRKIR